MNILKLTKYTLKSPSWKISQSLNVVNEVIMKFLAIILLVLAYDKREILLVFFCFYSFNFLFLIIYKRLLFKYKNYFYSTFLILIFISVLTYFFTGEYFYFLSSVIFVMTSRDLFNTNSYEELNKIAEKNNIDNTKFIGFSYILGVLLSVFLLPFFGLIADGNINYFTYFLLFLIIIIFTYFLIINYKKIKSEKIEKFEKFTTPRSVYLQNGLSTFCNITSFFGVRFLFPLFLFDVFTKYGLDKNIFSYIGILAGIIALLNLISKKKQNIINNDILMFNNYLIYVGSWILFGIFFIIFKNSTSNLLDYFIILGIFILNLLMEYSSKLWSIGFIQTLKDQANFYQNEENKVLLNYKSYLTTFMIFKALGGVLGFFVAYLLYYILNFEYIIIILGVISIIYQIFVKKYFNTLKF